PLAAAAYAAHGAGVSVTSTVATLAVAWYALEMTLVRAVRWHLTPFYPLVAMLRDLLLPVLWIDAWIGTDFEWRGNTMSVAADSMAADDLVTESVATDSRTA